LWYEKFVVAKSRGTRFLLKASVHTYICAGLPDFSWCKRNKIGKNVTRRPQKYQIAIKYTTIAIKIPNGLKEPKNFHPKTFPNIPKLTFLVSKYTIWQPCTCVQINGDPDIDRKAHLEAELPSVVTCS
jgi:hypothetical protein